MGNLLPSKVKKGRKGKEEEEVRRRRKNKRALARLYPPLGGVGGGNKFPPAGEGGSGGGRPARAFPPRWGGGLGGGSPQAGSGAEPQPPVTSYDVIDDVNCKNFPLKFLQKRHFFTPKFFIFSLYIKEKF